MFKKPELLLLGSLLLFSAGAGATTMRCGTALINLGDSADMVREKCGAPDSSVDQLPALRSNGVNRYNAAKVSLWVYGPSNGAYRHLRFIDDKLVDINTRRD